LSITAHELAGICAELGPRLSGAHVRKVHQPLPHELVLGLQASEGNVRLLLSVHPRLARMHLLAGPRTNPMEPPSFALAVRRRLEGAHITAIEQSPGERVVRIRFARGDETRSIVAELFGTRAALLLLDDDDQVVAGTGARLAGDRFARPGTTYVFPEPLPRADADTETAEPGIHDAVARREEDAEARLGLEGGRARRNRVLAREKKKLGRLRDKLERDVENLPDPELCRQRGEALKAALHEVPRGASEIRLTTWTADGAQEILVPLDPKRDARDNMERWFHRARRSERATEHMAARLVDARARLAQIEVERERLMAIEDAAEFGPEPETKSGQVRSAPSGSSGPPHFTSSDGYELIVGRSAQENEVVTFRLARGRDTWLHVRDRPGAHVVIRTPTGRPPPLDTLLDAAILAVHHSSVRGASGVDVAYTLRKHVRALKGAPRGTVSVAGERTLRVDPDAERLERLYGTKYARAR
jgi:predicted ribosome quality control (RQC) complex YloA/Tae2 family protein